MVTDDVGETIVTTPKTGNSRRVVHLSPDAVQVLVDQRAHQQVQREMMTRPVKGHPKGYARARPWVDSGRVFTNTFGAELDPHNLRREMARICEAAGVRVLTIHGLRHTYASLSLMQGVPVEVVSKQLGHSSPAFTLSQYRWVYQSEREAWALGLEQLTAGKN